jgi:hypothetical protein
MPFTRVDLASTKQDGKEREHGRHPQLGVAQDPRCFAAFAETSLVLEQHVEAGRDSFELQRDVRNAADDGDHGDEPRDCPAFAEAGGEQVGDRGNAMRL